MVDPVALLDVAGEEAFITEGIDEARNAFGIAVNAPERAVGEGGFAVRAGGMEAVLDVGP